MTATTAISTRKPYALLVSGVGTAATGLYHFFLPRIYGWEADMRHAPAELGWALLSLKTTPKVIPMRKAAKAE